MPQFCPTPGAYIKMRREAAGFSIADIAAQVATEPRVAEHVRADWIALIEADVMPAQFRTIVVLRGAFSFDLDVLESLVAISMGAPYAAPRICRICACSEHDACLDIFGDGCSWSEPDLCSECTHAEPSSAAIAGPLPGNDQPAIAAGAAA